MDAIARMCVRFSVGLSIFLSDFLIKFFMICAQVDWCASDIRQKVFCCEFHRNSMEWGWERKRVSESKTVKRLIVILKQPKHPHPLLPCISFQSALMRSNQTNTYNFNLFNTIMSFLYGFISRFPSGNRHEAFTKRNKITISIKALHSYVTQLVCNACVFFFSRILFFSISRLLSIVVNVKSPCDWNQYIDELIYFSRIFFFGLYSPFTTGEPV